MNHKELNNYIFHYLKKDKTQTAIMLNGEWGSGKSFYLKNDLIPFLRKRMQLALLYLCTVWTAYLRLARVYT